MKIVPAILAVLAANACAEDNPVARVELRPVIAAQQVEVRLGDVADIHSRDLRTMRRLVTLPLGERPAAGSDVVVRRDVLERWVRLRLGLARGAVEWQGPAQAVIRTFEAQAVAPARAEIEAASRTRQSMHLVARGDWASLRLRSGGIEVQARVQVLQDGAAGDVVRVRASRASEAVDARVISAGYVEAAL